MNENPIPEDYQCDHLILLVGMNPLPNYVVAKLLTHNNSTIYLLHSDGTDQTPSTKPYAEFLRDVLRKYRPNIVLRGIHEADSDKIANKVHKIIGEAKIFGKVGLNYTGGTKAMSIHTYRAIAKAFPEATFSYLDARQLALRIDGVSKPYPVGRVVSLSLEDLSALHGYVLDQPATTPHPEVLLQALAKVHATEASFDQWRAWVKSGLSHLPDCVENPGLQPICEAFDELCGGRGLATPEKVAKAMGFEELKSCAKWFIGEWLEELVLAAINENVDAFDIKYFGIGLKPKPNRSSSQQVFDLDVAAMIGYQLFAVSCIVSTKAGGETKKHLFEAFVRARQLGGDEAQVALVCLSDTPNVIQSEVEREWHASGQVRVFGRPHLNHLPAVFRDWFQKANPARR